MSSVIIELLPLFEAPLTVMISNWLYDPRLIVPVSELLILYSVPVLVKLMIVPVLSAMCDFDDSNVVLVCAICCYLLSLCVVDFQLDRINIDTVFVWYGT